MNKIKNKSFFDKKINIHIVTVAILWAITLLTGILPPKLLALGVSACLVALFFFDRLYLAFPFVIFYNSFYGLGLGVSILRIFSMLVILNFVLRLRRKLSVTASRLLPFCVYALFIFLVFAPQAISLAVSVGLDVIACFIVVSELAEAKRFKDFFRVYVLVCLASFVSGWMVDNQIGNEFTYFRFMATFEDPNYMGFFFTVGIFSLIVLKLFDPKLRYLLVFVLYAMMLTSLSMTAIVVNLLVWVVYIALMVRGKKVRLGFRFWSILFLIVAFFIAIIIIGMSYPDIPVLGDISFRVKETIEEVLKGDFGAATTGRTTLAKKHLEYFASLPFLRILFGGISVNARYLHPDFTAAAHNEYVDLLLNVGVLGALVMLGYFFWTMRSRWEKYKATGDEEQLFVAVGKVIWMFYAMTLTVFLDYRFMLFFLI